MSTRSYEVDNLTADCLDNLESLTSPNPIVSTALYLDILLLASKFI
jgi:hypothetical protein